MKAGLLRGILAALLVATAAGKIWGSPGEPDLRAAAVAVIEAKGWPVSQGQGIPDLIGPPIHFTMPGCQRPTQVFLLSPNLQLLPLVERIVEADYTRRIVYMGRTWSAEDRMGLRLEWLKWKVLSVFRLGRFVASSTALMIAEPPGCNVAEAVDWGLAWDRRTIARLPAPGS